MRCARLTGIDYPQLATLNIASFKTQHTDAITNLLKEAENRNLSLLSTLLSQDLAREQIRYYQTGHTYADAGSQCLVDRQQYRLQWLAQ